MKSHLKENQMDELVKMHKHALSKVLPVTKYASPNFAQRNPNRRIRLLVDLVKFNSLLSDYYINIEHPVTTSSNKL